jgi:hypothetical protein
MIARIKEIISAYAEGDEVKAEASVNRGDLNKDMSEIVWFAEDEVDILVFDDEPFDVPENLEWDHMNGFPSAVEM